uniref:Secreted protein containing DUF1791 n=1 Tax=uncultured bacterium ws406H10 TaxID=1131831 RepID=I1X5F1_9BACT|nr:secreted protein containing DUF1791 [uncultured bacterium ws406H10]
MKFLTKSILTVFAALAMAFPALAAEGVHKLVLQISDNDKQKMNTVLNVAANVSRHYSEKGEEIDIKIVAFNAGLHMLRPDTSPVKDRMMSFGQSMPNVEFQACNNTRHAMQKKSGKDVPIFEFAEVVPAGVVSIMELDEAGYSVVRP